MKGRNRRDRRKTESFRKALIVGLYPELQEIRDTPTGFQKETVGRFVKPEEKPAGQRKETAERVAESETAEWFDKLEERMAREFPAVHKERDRRFAARGNPGASAGEA